MGLEVVERERKQERDLPSVLAAAGLLELRPNLTLRLHHDERAE